MEETSLSDLPLEIIHLILSKLPLSSYIRFATCLNRKHATPLFYHISMDTPLLLYHKTIDSGIWHYYSPSINKTFRVVCPNLNMSGFQILYAKDGWLLVYNEVDMLLLDPFSGTVHKLPGLIKNICFNGAMFFGSPPDNCTIFIVDAAYDEREVCITVYNENGWETEKYHKNNGSFCLAPSSNPVLCNNRIYCLGEDGNLGVYDPKERSWTVINAAFEQYDRTLMDNSYLVESGGMLLAVQAGAYDTWIRMFCLDQERMVWVETYDLVNQSLFLGSKMCTMSNIYMDQRLSSRVYVPRFLEEPETILVEAERIHNELYFKPKSIDYLDEKNKQDQETRICYHSLADRNPLKYFGSKLKVYSIWFEPCHHTCN